MEKSHLKRHELLFSRTVKSNYPASAGLNHQKSSKRGVRGIYTAMSPFLCGKEIEREHKSAGWLTYKAGFFSLHTGIICFSFFRAQERGIVDTHC